MSVRASRPGLETLSTRRSTLRDEVGYLLAVTDEYFLRSERLVWRAWSKTDLDLALSLWGNPRVTRFIDVRDRLSRDAVAQRLAAEMQMASDCGLQYWPIFFRDTGTFVGASGLRPRPLDKDTFEQGTHLLPDMWGLGLATEAGRTVVAYAFEHLKVGALFAGHHPQNARSARMLRKLGFVYTHDELYRPTGLHHPSYRMTIADFNRMRRGGAQLVPGARPE